MARMARIVSLLIRTHAGVEMATHACLVLDHSQNTIMLTSLYRFCKDKVHQVGT